MEFRSITRPMARRLPAAGLIERWSSRSLATCWPATADAWRGTAVDALCEHLCAPGGRPELLAATRALGEHRAAVGARLHEARADLAILLDLVAVGGRSRTEMFDAFTVGWAEAGVERLAAMSVVDATEMGTTAYLQLRLRELYRALGPDVREEYLLVLAETEPVRQRLVAEARLAALHSAAECSFMCGESIAAVSERRVAVLARREEPTLSASMMLLRHELDLARAEERLPNSRCWREGLPRRMEELGLTLLNVCE